MELGHSEADRNVHLIFILAFNFIKRKKYSFKCFYPFLLFVFTVILASSIPHLYHIFRALKLVLSHRVTLLFSFGGELHQRERELHLLQVSELN